MKLCLYLFYIRRAFGLYPV